MINLKRKEDCSGCGACVQACPQGCISFTTDYEGFWYPKIDTGGCIECNLCEKVCPVINGDSERTPLQVYAARNTDESVRAASSSGGIFSLVAEKVIAEGGVVFGVRFDSEWHAVFDYSETKDGLSLFRGSKYMQAVVGDAFIKAKVFLESGRKVLFSGTPCQIAGLRHFLGKDFENLLLLDLICAGVPSPKVWNLYLKEEMSKCKIANKTSVKSISFRNKYYGWKKYCLAMRFVNKDNVNGCRIIRKSAYMQAFFCALQLRPICYECPFKSSKSQSDITISDFWGIEKLHPEFDDDKGTSMLLINTKRGLSYIESTKSAMVAITTEYSMVFPYNVIISPVPFNFNREIFFNKIDKTKNISLLMMRYRMTRKDRLLMYLRSCVGDNNYQKLRRLWLKIK